MNISERVIIGQMMAPRPNVRNRSLAAGQLLAAPKNAADGEFGVDSGQRHLTNVILHGLVIRLKIWVRWVMEQKLRNPSLEKS